MGKKQIKNKKDKVLEEEKKRKKIDEEDAQYNDGFPDEENLANRETPPWALISKW